MYFQYMASNAPFREQEDTNLISVRMRDAEALGYKLPEWCTPEFYSYEHNKNQRIIVIHNNIYKYKTIYLNFKNKKQCN